MKPGIPFLQPPCQIKVGAVVECATAQYLLQSQTWMLERRLALPSAKPHFISLIVYSVGGVWIYFVVEEGIVV
jgi:ABC-type nitrate/sulfonate/bicarbonate transport system permease component